MLEFTKTQLQALVAAINRRIRDKSISMDELMTFHDEPDEAHDNDYGSNYFSKEVWATFRIGPKNVQMGVSYRCTDDEGDRTDAFECKVGECLNGKWAYLHDAAENILKSSGIVHFLDPHNSTRIRGTRPPLPTRRRTL